MKKEIEIKATNLIAGTSGCPIPREIYEYFTDAEIGLFAHLVKEHSKVGGHSEYKQGKLDKLEGKLKQLRSF